MNYIQIANETLKIIKDKKYSCNGQKIAFPEGNFEEVMVISPSDGRELLADDISKFEGEKPCLVEVINADSFQAARRYENPLVMNFANAHVPGGGFLLGATAQEESLCRCSTLYASIHSETASEMYRYNSTHLSPVESDYMLLSPRVLVFRDESCVLLAESFRVGVITIPAPNRHGAALLASGKTIEEVMLRRIRIMLRVAIKYGYRDLILGAWGCGAFGNNPKNVAEYFYQVLVKEGYGRCFEHVCFAVYGREDGKNITAFRERFLSGAFGEK